jgi:2-keto-3-deoxy-L-fuconate dehydrogenase
MGRLAGTKTVITGAGSGIGHALALAFAEEGAAVWATGRSLGSLQPLKGRSGIEIAQLDVTHREAVARAAETIGPVGILVNCAGIVPEGTLLECSDEMLEEAIAVNLKGVFTMMRHFLPGMIAGGGGAVINIASVLSSLTSAPARFAYGATKAAVIGMTKSVALDYAGHGIRCNAVCPGAIDTEGLRGRIAAAPDPGAVRAAMIGRHRLGRIGKVSEVVGACLYLASAEGSFVTGQTLVIDGGMTL